VNVVVIVGNPKVASRTRAAAEGVAERLTGARAAQVIEVAELGPHLLGWGAPEVEAARRTVQNADLIVVACPTFKATYTGLLKLFLDQFGAGELVGVVAIPVMLGAAPHHSLAPELTLKPVLVEIGCSCPTPALYLLDSNVSPEAIPDAWIERSRRAIPFLQEQA